MRGLRILIFGLAAAGPAPAQARSPVVLELFTSQSCSSCPPADALLGDLKAENPDLLPLSLHVDYWNRTGWQDRYSSPAMTLRQHDYTNKLGEDQIYTPELVVDGAEAVVGSDEDAVNGAIKHARAAQDRAASIPLQARRQGRDILVDVGSGPGTGELLLLGYDDQHVTQIGSGENAGQKLVEVNIVRSIASLGGWSGAPLALRTDSPAGEHLAILLQSPDGRILAACSAP